PAPPQGPRSPNPVRHGHATRGQPGEGAQQNRKSSKTPRKTKNRKKFPKYYFENYFTRKALLASYEG
ncbi:MAG: hypothetical protein ACTSP1_03445, partial [Candidatus Freyarchaeota archaeon]